MAAITIMCKSLGISKQDFEDAFAECICMNIADIMDGVMKNLETRLVELKEYNEEKKGTKTTPAKKKAAKKTTPAKKKPAPKKATAKKTAPKKTTNSDDDAFLETVHAGIKKAQENDKFYNVSSNRAIAEASARKSYAVDEKLGICGKQGEEKFERALALLGAGKKSTKKTTPSKKVTKAPAKKAPAKKPKLLTTKVGDYFVAKGTDIIVEMRKQKNGSLTTFALGRIDRKTKKKLALRKADKKWCEEFNIVIDEGKKTTKKQKEEEEEEVEEEEEEVEEEEEEVDEEEEEEEDGEEEEEEEDGEEEEEDELEIEDGEEETDEELFKKVLASAEAEESELTVTEDEFKKYVDLIEDEVNMGNYVMLKKHGLNRDVCKQIEDNMATLMEMYPREEEEDENADKEVVCENGCEGECMCIPAEEGDEEEEEEEDGEEEEEEDVEIEDEEEEEEEDTAEVVSKVIRRTTTKK